MTGDLRLALKERADRGGENVAALENNDSASVISAPDFTSATELLTGELR